ncbi:MAG: glycoside hydrolase family 16 protein [Planctomycetes bacterium]|nr:glycoside hydrolase family 16 protein [Planctomycetota bacterium]
MKTLAFVVLVVSLALPAGAEPWRLVWSDEFDGSGLPDQEKWGYEEGFVRNNERQYYTSARKENTLVKDGLLVIRANKERYANPRFRGDSAPADGRHGRKFAEYTSASVTSRGKVTWRYGRIEVRAKLPTGRGMWPAIWMLGTKNGWPACGELDIMENVGFAPDVIHANVHTTKYNHTKGNGKGAKITVEKPYETFHVYAIEWNKDRIDFFLDDQKYFTYTNEGTGVDAWPFDSPHYLILNIAVGGSWGGQRGIDDAVFPQEMAIDYVRVYQKDDSSGNQ